MLLPQTFLNLRLFVFVGLQKKRVRLIYITDVFIPDDDGGERMRKGALSSIEYVKYWVDYVNRKRVDKHKGFLFELVEVRNRTEYLNEYMLNKVSNQIHIEKEPIDIFLGPDSSNIIESIIGVNQLLQIPVLSCGATASKFDYTAKKYSIVRFLPSDAYRTEMLIKLINTYGWNYLAVLTSEGTNTNEAYKFVSKIQGQKRRVMVNLVYGIVKKSDICSMVKNLTKLSNKVLIFFTNPTDTRRVLKCMRDQKLYDRFTMVFFYASNNDRDVSEGNEKLLDGSIGLGHTKNPVSNTFQQSWFLPLNPKTSPDNMLLKLYWENTFNCSANHVENPNVNNCLFNESLSIARDLYISRASSHIPSAFSAMSEILQGAIKPYCKNYTKYKVCDEQVESNRFPLYMKLDAKFRELRTVDNYVSSTNIIRYYVINSRWNENLERFGNHEVGLWKVRFFEDGRKTEQATFLINPVWWGAKLQYKTPSGKCSEPCQLGHAYLFNYTDVEGSFCWKCIRCKSNEIVANNTCVRCSDLERADPHHLRCLPMVRMELLSSHHKSTMHALWAVLGYCAVLCVIIGIVVLWNRYIRMFCASGFVLWVFILLGILLLVVGAFTFSLPASKIFCALQVCIPTFGLALCHISLCAKAFRINHTFVGVAKVSYLRNVFGEYPYEVISIVVLVIQLVVLLAVSLGFGVKIEERLSDNANYVSRHCPLSMHPILFLLYGLVVLLCSYEAYKIRNYPQNEGETKDIAITTFLSLLLTIVVLSAFFAPQVKDPYYKEVVMCWFYALNAIIMLFGLFSKKIFLLIRQRIIGKPKNGSIHSPRFRTFSENIGKTNNITDIKSIVETHAKPQPVPEEQQGLYESVI